MRLTIKHCHWCGEMGHVKEDCPSAPGRDEIARLNADKAKMITALTRIGRGGETVSAHIALAVLKEADHD